MKKFSRWVFENNAKQIDLAEALGVSTTTMHNLIKKDAIPTLELAIAIEEYTNEEVTVYDWSSNKKENRTSPKIPKKTAKRKMKK